MNKDIERLIKGAESKPRNLSVDEIAFLLDTDESGVNDLLSQAASRVKASCGKNTVLKRALIECSNICAKDCLYCGIRKSNPFPGRYRVKIEEVKELISKAREEGFDAVAFQAGEMESEDNTRYYEQLVESSSGLEVTLSLGEQDECVYRRWRNAGAMRYLLRIESSDPELYGKIHPSACSFSRRLQCLRSLKKLGFFTGTGVMIGIPGQTMEHLAKDIVFFGEEEMDMVGMGPYLVHPEAPLANYEGPWALRDERRRVEVALRMIALTRLYLHSVNIVSATALEVAAGKGGRISGIEYGANVIMPVMTPSRFRKDYDIYPGKANEKN